MRGQLYEAALRLFRKRGYEATTVQDIAEAADAARGTFFLHFPTKEHLLLEYHQEMGRYILEAIRTRTFPSAERAVQAALRECAAWFVNDPAMAKLIIRLFFGSDLLMHSDQENEARLSEWLEGYLEAGQQRGELRRGLEIGFFISMLMGVLSSTVIEWVSGEHPFDLEGRVEQKVRFLFDAARA